MKTIYVVLLRTKSLVLLYGEHLEGYIGAFDTREKAETFLEGYKKEKSSFLDVIIKEDDLL